MAGWTGLEPAASAVTGRRYNQLNYHPAAKTRVNERDGYKEDPRRIQLEIRGYRRKEGAQRMGSSSTPHGCYHAGNTKELPP